MTSAVLTALSAVLSASAATLAIGPRPGPPGRGARDPAPVQIESLQQRSRLGTGVIAALAGAAALLFVGGTAGVFAGLFVAVGCYRVLRRAEPAAARRLREQTTLDLPHLIGLMASGLRVGAPPATALAAACAALPGPAAEAFAATRARLDLGVDPVLVWQELAEAKGAPTSGVASLGRTLARAHQTGASVCVTVEALADELAREGRAAVEDRARSVGVKAALPLGLCLLPAFLLLGIVPVVAGLAAQLMGG